jgi:hypothetical protein
MSISLKKLEEVTPEVESAVLKQEKRQKLYEEFIKRQKQKDLRKSKEAEIMKNPDL